MRNVSHFCRSLCVLTCFFATVLAAAAGFAQETTKSMLTDPRMVVIPSRTQAEIGSDIDNATAAKQLALDRKSQSELRLKQIESTIESKKLALKDVNRRKDEAKKSKNESGIIAAQIETKANEQAVDLLNKLKDLRKAEIEAAQVETEQAEIDISVLQMERELLLKRVAYDSLSASGVDNLTLTTAQQVLRELEVRLLKLQQDQASQTQKLASKQKDIISRRMKLHEAQLKMGMPRA